jgi:adenine-specific DNA-methyltransferase
MIMKKNYSSWSKEELVRELEKVGKRKKYGIVWENKQEEVAEQCKEKLPILEEIKKSEILSDKEKETVNILIEGDNYHALSVLNYTHLRSVDVIYIDPPYNTGNKDFKYNDLWVEIEDSYRHSKWLSFMEKRLRLAWNLLKKNGVIFISINDIEQAQLKLLCDEIFDEKNFVAKLVWSNKEGGGSSDSKHFRIKHEYILCYAKNIFELEIKGVSITNEDRYTMSDKYLDTRGKYYLQKLNQASIQYSQSLDYPINSPDGTEIFPKQGNKRACWRWSMGKLKWGIENDFIVFKKDKNNKWQVYSKQYMLVDNEGNVLERTNRPFGIIDQYSSILATKHLENMFHNKVFDYPKPYELIRYLIERHPNNNATVLDFMAGTGTTGEAVLDLNKDDGGNRRFILCTNNENNICEGVCLPRIKMVIKGYLDLADKKVEGIGGNLKYFKTDFVDAEPTDDNKRKLVDKSTEMLCLKEDCFDELTKGHNFSMFASGQNKHLGIIYDDDGIEPFKKEIKKLNKKFVVYVFSLDDSAREEEFEDVRKLVELRPIPAVILNVYRRIFK